jgi:hypothetical protein
MLLLPLVLNMSALTPKATFLAAFYRSN